MANSPVPSAGRNPKYMEHDFSIQIKLGISSSIRRGQLLAPAGGIPMLAVRAGFGPAGCWAGFYARPRPRALLGLVAAGVARVAIPASCRARRTRTGHPHRHPGRGPFVLDGAGLSCPMAVRPGCFCCGLFSRQRAMAQHVIFNPRPCSSNTIPFPKSCFHRQQGLSGDLLAIR